MIRVSLATPPQLPHGRDSHSRYVYDLRVEPFKIVGRTYYVGDLFCPSYLIDADEGLVLLDTPFSPSAYLLIQSIWELGYDPKDIKYFPSRFQSSCKSSRCSGPRPPYLQTASFSVPSQMVSHCVPHGCWRSPASHPPDTGSGMATVPADSTEICPARTLARRRSSFQPMPIKRPSPAWTGSDAVHIALPAAAPPIPAQYRQYSSPSSAAHPARCSFGRAFTASSNFRRRCAQQPTTRIFSDSRW